MKPLELKEFIVLLMLLSSFKGLCEQVSCFGRVERNTLYF